jgi:hypothetical protein
MQSVTMARRCNQLSRKQRATQLTHERQLFSGSSITPEDEAHEHREDDLDPGVFQSGLTEACGVESHRYAADEICPKNKKACR